MKTRVLYLDHTSKLGGAEYALLRLLSGIDRTLVEPIVLFADEGAAPALFRDAGFETHVLPLDSKIREVRKDALNGSAFLHLGRAAALGSYAVRVASFAKRERVQIIHTNSMKAHFYGGVAGKLAGIPVVWHIRDFIDTSYLPRAAVSVVRFLARVLPSHVVAVSQSVMDQIHLPNAKDKRSAASEKSTVVHDGLTEDELGNRAPVTSNGASPRSGADREQSALKLPVRIGLVGRLAPWKGQHVFLQAAAKLIAAGYNAQFLIVGAPLFGEHEYEKELHQMTARLNVGSKIEFLGFRKDVPAVLDTLDILVHASTSADPCPNTILEGMAHGLPVVGSNGGGVPELIVDGETGLLVPMGDADGLADALKLLLDDPAKARQFGRAGYVRVRQHFTSSRVASQIHEVYRRVSPTPDLQPAAA